MERQTLPLIILCVLSLKLCLPTQLRSSIFLVKITSGITTFGRGQGELREGQCAGVMGNVQVASFC